MSAIYMFQIRALDHLILGPKFGPIPNAKKYVFSQFNKNIFFLLFGSPSLFHIIQIQNMLHIYNFTE